MQSRGALAAGSCRGSDAKHMRPSSPKSSIEHLCQWRGRWWSSWQPSELSAPGQPPDLQGVQIDARRRNNRRIGSRGSAEGDLMERILSPLAARVGHSSPPFVTESLSLSPVLPVSFILSLFLVSLFYRGIASAHRGSVRHVALALRRNGKTCRPRRGN